MGTQRTFFSPVHDIHYKSLGIHHGGTHTHTHSHASHTKTHLLWITIIYESLIQFNQSVSQIVILSIMENVELSLECRSGFNIDQVTCSKHKHFMRCEITFCLQCRMPVMANHFGGDVYTKKLHAFHFKMEYFTQNVYESKTKQQHSIRVAAEFSGNASHDSNIGKFSLQVIPRG